MTDAQKREINRTLSTDEEWILKQTYTRRWKPDDEWLPVSLPDGSVKWSRIGVGPQKVGIDHIAWMRAKLMDVELHGDVNLRDQEYAWSVERMFLASGRPVYDPAILAEMAKGVVEPWVGDIEEATDANGRPLVVPGSEGWSQWSGTS
jgi:hypothetical protein